jgi:CelD/BcsL family acetyltransferase involved in cellulose biosynthesis
MSFTVTQESFDSLASYWGSPDKGLNWGSVFVLPDWLSVWWREFQPEAELFLAAVRDDKDIIGIAPLQLNEGEGSFIGDTDVCDYLDFIIAPGRESDFYNALLDELVKRDVHQLDLRHLRPDSTVIAHLMDIARSRKYEAQSYEDDISLELDLPPSFEEYLTALTKKQRHEVRRKLRRLWEEGNVNYDCAKVTTGTGDFLDTFLELFALSKEEKADFMTDQMESFFRSVTGAMASLGLLRIGTLEVGGTPVAMIIGFDYNETMYLYNSAFNPDYSYLSVGVLSKVLCIKESIQRGMKKWDFLKGSETYKYHLGGIEVPLHCCQITIK